MEVWFDKKEAKISKTDFLYELGDWDISRISTAMAALGEKEVIAMAERLAGKCKGLETKIMSVVNDSFYNSTDKAKTAVKVYINCNPKETVQNLIDILIDRN